ACLFANDGPDESNREGSDRGCGYRRSLGLSRLGIGQRGHHLHLNMRAFVTRAQKAGSRLGRLNGDGWRYGGLPWRQWEAENARKADPKLMRSIRDDIESHPAFHDYYRACINCGNCTAVCPAFRFADFGPRIVVQKVMHARDEPELLYQMVDQYIWACFQCYACWDVCPAQNNPGGLVAIIK